MDSNVTKPLVSVIMPVYNCENYLHEAIKSILNQTFHDFEFLVIDDYSSDNSTNVIESFKDNRIKLIKKNSNTGISDTLNLGLKYALGKYIVRMDADDISSPLRIEKQINFLESNPEYILCASNYNIIGSNKIIILPEESEDIKLTLIDNCCIAHPTVVLRKKTLEINNISYSKDAEPAEDYNLWIELINFGKFYNIQDNLLSYRIHQKQISQKRKKEQDIQSFNVKVNYLNNIYNKPIDNTFKLILKKLLLTKEKIKKEDLNIFSKSLKDIKKSNIKSQNLSVRKFNSYLLHLENLFLENYFAKNKRYTLKDFLEYLRINKYFKLRLNFKNKLKLFFKSIFFYKI